MECVQAVCVCVGGGGGGGVNVWFNSDKEIINR